MAGNRNAQADAARCGLQESDGSRSLARPRVWRELLPLLSLAEQIMAMPAHAPHPRWTEEEFSNGAAPERRELMTARKSRTARKSLTARHHRRRANHRRRQARTSRRRTTERRRPQ